MAPFVFRSASITLARSWLTSNVVAARRLRLHGLIARIPHTQRYQLTDFGLKTALFYSRVYQRALRPGLSELCDPKTAHSAPLAQAFAKFQKALDTYTDEKIAA